MYRLDTSNVRLKFKIANIVFSRYYIIMIMDRSIDMLNRWARVIAADGYERGLKPAQWQALRFLKSANRFSRTPGGLTAWLGQTKGTVSQTIITLVTKGLVVRSGDALDSRVVRLDLTSLGHAVISQPPAPVAQAMLMSLSADDQRSFVAMIEKMLLAHLAARRQQPFGVCQECRHFQRSQQSASTHHCQLLDVPLTEEDSQQICVEQEAA
jgi:DNA-binding MarR family transcriptional regulator